MVTPAEKDALDVWYVRHASFWLDLKIAVSTALFGIFGERMNQPPWRRRWIGAKTISPPAARRAQAPNWKTTRPPSLSDFPMRRRWRRC